MKRILLKILGWTIKCTLCLVLFVVLFLLAVDVNFLGLFGSSPTIEDIQRPATCISSEVYSDDGKMIGKFYNENRSPVKYEDVSPILIRTLIDTEDIRFYEHFGVDFRGLLSAIKDMITGRARGASTITQQLAKNMFHTRGQYSSGFFGKLPVLRLVVAKSKEWILATKLETVYSKEDILTMYLNQVDFGCNAFGIKTAANTYFSTTPDKLTYEQSATLIATLKATTTYNPRNNPDNNLERRNLILQLVYNNDDMMIDGQMANEFQLDSLQSLPLGLVAPKDESRDLGKAPYFRDALDREMKRLCASGDILGYDASYPINPYTDGLKIYTTLDTRLQKYAENAVNRHMREVQSSFNSEWGGSSPWRDEKGNVIPDFIEKLARKTQEYQYLKSRFEDNQDSIRHYLNQPHPCKVFAYGGAVERNMSTMDSIRYMVTFMHCGFVAIEPGSRKVRAWVGDIDYDSWQYDKVTAQRQPGSTFKLFVYTEAIRKGMKPTDTMVDKQITYNVNGVKWTPHNAGSFSGRAMTLQDAMARSVNSVAVQLADKCGINNVIRTAHEMGVKSELKANLSTALGASDVNLLEMANSYCTVAGDGVYQDPVLISRITRYDEDLGEEIEIYNIQNSTRTRNILPERIAAIMQKMLQNGTNAGGTSARLRSYIPHGEDTDFGGKTGTTNNHSDAWYMGITPGLVGGVWVGGEYRSIHFRSGSMGQGAKAAMPVFAYFMEYVLSDSNFPQYHRRFSGRHGLNGSDWDSIPERDSVQWTHVRRHTEDEAPADDYDPYNEDVIDPFAGVDLGSEFEETEEMIEGVEDELL